jgi:flagellum-specific ATP synthase
MRPARSAALALDPLPPFTVYGRVGSVVGLGVEVEGLAGLAGLHDRCRLIGDHGGVIEGEVVGFQRGRTFVQPFAATDGVRPGVRVELCPGAGGLAVSDGWVGRVVDGLGYPADGRGPLPRGPHLRPPRAAPPPAHARGRIGGKIDLGVRALNAFLTCCRGQRLGIFAGSGVGKSSLLAMIARYAHADVNVIGLIGERGREAREFIEDDLGAAGLARSVVVVATSDQPPALRRQAALTAMAIAEHFRDQGKDVLCLMDSVTRLALAQREIGLAAGEPPTTKGYPPSVFAELPRLLERAGPGAGAGSITGLFTVLVDGDDFNEPVADAVRGILDGHVVLDRAIAERGRYPAINILKSVSRALPRCNSDAENDVIRRARRLLAVYDDMAELIRLGAYQPGSDAETDRAIRLMPALEAFLSQRKDEPGPLGEVYDRLERILAEAPTIADAKR